MYLNRARTLNLLGCPDLSAMDAYKCLILCDVGLNQGGDPKLGEVARNQYGMSLQLGEEAGAAIARNIAGYGGLKEIKKLG